MEYDLGILEYHFPELTPIQRAQYKNLARLVATWNAKINLVSRADIDNLPRRHLLHSLAIAKIARFESGTRILDVGTGGGFPGLPLAIFFPQCRFHLIDSIGKKIKAVSAFADELGLDNVSAEQARAESIPGRFDFIVARAVTQLPRFMGWIRDRVGRQSSNELANGVLYLKGGDLADEFQGIPETPEIFPIRNYFDYEEFKDKYILHIPVG